MKETKGSLEGIERVKATYYLECLKIDISSPNGAVSYTALVGATLLSPYQ